jgi:RsiW-degrading membrane proteinase PrsW (M82 family)
MLTLICLYLFLASAIFLPVFFLKRHPGSREPKKALWGVPIGFGLLAIIAGSILNEIFIPLDPTSADKITLPIAGLFVATIGVGIIEEACKFWPAAFFLHKKSYFDQYTDGMIYFGFIGLFFGLIEDVMYLSILGPGTGFARIIIALYFHAALTGILGFYFAGNNIKGKPLYKILGPFFIIAGIHGFYDFCLMSESILILTGVAIGIGLNVALFIYFNKAVKLDKERLSHVPQHTPVVVEATGPATQLPTTTVLQTPSLAPAPQANLPVQQVATTTTPPRPLPPHPNPLGNP